jgi:hypothetical protein
MPALETDFYVRMTANTIPRANCTLCARTSNDENDYGFTCRFSWFVPLPVLCPSVIYLKIFSRSQNTMLWHTFVPCSTDTDAFVKINRAPKVKLRSVRRGAKTENIVACWGCNRYGDIIDSPSPGSSIESSAIQSECQDKLPWDLLFAKSNNRSIPQSFFGRGKISTR